MAISTIHQLIGSFLTRAFGLILLFIKLLRTRDIACNINKHVKEHAQLLSTIKKWIQVRNLGSNPLSSTVPR